MKGKSAVCAPVALFEFADARRCRLKVSKGRGSAINFVRKLVYCLSGCRDPHLGVHGAGGKRRLVTIADVRREYGAELDKRSDILQGRFPLVFGDDQMDVL